MVVDRDVGGVAGEGVILAEWRTGSELVTTRVQLHPTTHLFHR